ncbi:MAG TPA: hydroxyacylglutathione hydrolase [Kiritimatiellia bacterium]|nr:hydroxyacylglutathione hydrolase [Kiritimatiellia bacterium]HMO97811.1 hydroxyacylglutathione hydrolase [Kiritimatiellia bacterium]HMP96442.1 hydroxyacylglutathione hydrolase [Kiritimatiellia bacterium]
MKAPSLHVVPCLSDNYAFVLFYENQALVIDPGDAGPVSAVLKRYAPESVLVVLTHYHHDHIGGVSALRKQFQVTLGGPLPAPWPLDQAFTLDEPYAWNGLDVQVMATPGHAFPHVAYYFPRPGWLFSGDCLFGAGCGRLAGDVAPVLWHSLQRLATLPESTLVYFGHEYTLSNLAFAAAMEPDNPAIARRRTEVEQRLLHGDYGAPSTMAEEKATNPFLRTDEPSIRRALGLASASAVDVFAALRAAKNVFPG